MAHSTAPKIPQAILVGVALPQTTDADNEESLDELARLVKTLGFQVTGKLTQRRQSLAGGTVLGQGKLEELAKLTGGTGAVERKVRKKTKAALKQEAGEPEPEVPPRTGDVVVFDCELSPSQLANVQRATDAEVLDRTGVILEIFSRHARTREARLQVELARLKYLSPRLRHTGGPSDRMNKAGESSLELDRRKIRDRIAELKNEIEAVQTEQSQGRTRRAGQNCVALVGYTNAGKSSLMRALTASEVLVEDKLFATLDTTVRALHPPSFPSILISDTVGFIKKLPHDLVVSFRSTLEEARNADLLLYVVDGSDPSFRNQLAVTREVLSSIGVQGVPALLLVNKCDKIPPQELQSLRSEFQDAILLSAKNPVEVAGLRERLIRFFDRGLMESEVFVPYARSRDIGLLRSRVRVLGERHTEEGTFVKVLADPAELERLLGPNG